MKSNAQEELAGVGATGQAQQSANSAGARQDAAPPDQKAERAGSQGGPGERQASRDGGGEANAPSGQPAGSSSGPGAGAST